MAALRGRLFAGALFSGELFNGAEEAIVVTSSGGGKIFTVNRSDYEEAIDYQEADDEETIVALLLTELVRQGII